MIPFGAHVKIAFLAGLGREMMYSDTLQNMVGKVISLAISSHSMPHSVIRFLNPIQIILSPSALKFQNSC